MRHDKIYLTLPSNTEQSCKITDDWLERVRMRLAGMSCVSYRVSPDLLGTPRLPYVLAGAQVFCRQLSNLYSMWYQLRPLRSREPRRATSGTQFSRQTP